jgi:hypothetical protein
MTAITPNQILMLYIWFPLAMVIAILLLIARFYERFSGDRTYYLGYLIPLVLFGAGAVRYASVDQIAGDWLGDVFMGAAGAVLITLSLLLYRLMTTGRRD